MFKYLLLVILLGFIFSIAGCGGGSGSDSPIYGTGYYVDSAVVGVDTKCGSKEGKTEAAGKFTFEVGKGCAFFLGEIKLRDIDKAILNNGVTVYETEKYTAQILQSLDSDGNPDNGITVAEEFVTALATANITTLPRNEAEATAMLVVIENAGGTIVTEADAQTHAYSTLISSKNLYFIDIQGNNAQEDIGPLLFQSDGSLVGARESIWRFVGDKLYLGTGSDYQQIISVTEDYIIFKGYEGNESTIRAYFDETKAKKFMATLFAPDTPEVCRILTTGRMSFEYNGTGNEIIHKNYTTSEVTNIATINATGIFQFTEDSDNCFFHLMMGKNYSLFSVNLITGTVSEFRVINVQDYWPFGVYKDNTIIGVAPINTTSCGKDGGTCQVKVFSIKIDTGLISEITTLTSGVPRQFGTSVDSINNTITYVGSVFDNSLHGSVDTTYTIDLITGNIISSITRN